MKRLLLPLLALALPLFSFAQDFTYADVSTEVLTMKQYGKDTSAHAVVLREYGNSRMDVAADNYVKLIYQYHVKIKIFDSRAFDKGTVQVRLSSNSVTGETINDISGYTEYIDDDGSVKKIELQQDQIYRLKESQNRENVKFVLPGLKKGCVIEYRYTVETPFYENFKPWLFQDNIPKMYSEYDVHIPGFWNYNVVIRGGLKLTKKTGELESNCFKSHGASSDCSHFVYGMSDIPAFETEEYMTAPKNFLSAVYFELADYTDPFTGAKKKMSKEWADVDNSLKHEDYFGGQIKRTSLMKPKILPVIAGKTDDLDKAKAIFAYIKKSIKWNNVDSHYSRDIGAALEKHTGGAGDINLALVAALNAAGLNGEAVMLSTRNNGIVNKLYPTIDDFDYVIAKVNIGQKSYFLDATEPLIAFGVLPLRCLNGEGRAMSLDKPSYWVDVNSDQKETSTTNLDLTLQPDGKIKGTLVQFASGYAGFLKRQAIKKFNSIDEYIDNRAEHIGKIKIVKAHVDNVDSLDMPVAESFDIEFDGTRNMNAASSNFSLFIFDHVVNNPFKLEDRTYPVNMGMPSEHRYIITLHLPDGYVGTSELKPLSMALVNQGGRFVSDLQLGEQSATYSNILQFNKSVYSPEEYASLKEFYNRIILSEKQPLVIKKAK